jgi:hypothetical protein
LNADEMLVFPLPILLWPSKQGDSDELPPVFPAAILSRVPVTADYPKLD